MVMSKYRDGVRQAAKERKGTPLYNSSLAHASILTEAIFENANESVKILSGKLNAHVYGKSGVIEKARLFLADPSHKIKVLLEKPDEVDKEDHPFYQAFKDNNDVEFHKFKGEVFKIPSYHFAVMDNDSYRFEKDKNEPNAIAAFGNTGTAEHLNQIFETLFTDSEKF